MIGRSLMLRKRMLNVTRWLRAPLPMALGCTCTTSAMKVPALKQRGLLAHGSAGAAACAAAQSVKRPNKAVRRWLSKIMLQVSFVRDAMLAVSGSAPDHHVHRAARIRGSAR